MEPIIVFKLVVELSHHLHLPGAGIAHCGNYLTILIGIFSNSYMRLSFLYDTTHTIGGLCYCLQVSLALSGTPPVILIAHTY